MKVTINGTERTLRAGTTLKTAIQGEPYSKGSLVAVHLSEERVVEETSDFEIVTTHGTMVLRLNDSEEARMWKADMGRSVGMSSRWVTRNIVSFGSIPTDLQVDRGSYHYRMYDVFFALGGFDNHTTYIMIARDNHVGSYGAGKAVFGRITVGRHILDKIREGDAILEIRPVMSETSREDVTVTDDLSFKLEDGYRVETYLGLKLDPRSPVSAEHAIILASRGYMDITEETGSYAACSEDMDVSIPKEDIAVREQGAVTVRNEGVGLGRLYIYRERRQLSPAHNNAGTVTAGRALYANAHRGSTVTVVTDPPRALAVGMTMKEGEEFLRSRGVRTTRTGDVSDDAIIAEQVPERTLEVLPMGEAEIFGVPRERVFKVKVDDRDAITSHYFRKVTGLSHKPVGSMKVQFTFEGLPMVTFYGDDDRGKDLYPQEPFKKVRRGDIGVTNQARPHRGLLGIRLEDSKEFGPTGEEGYGTNIVGRFEGDLDRLMDGLEEEDVVYITEVDL